MIDSSPSEDSYRTQEGGIFHSTGKMLVGLASREEAKDLRRRFIKIRLEASRCKLIDNEPFASQEAKNLECPSVPASLGSEVPIRCTQLERARAGRHFLQIDTPDDGARERNVVQLSGAAVRYSIVYRTLIIEDLIHHIRTSTSSAEAGAPGGAIG